MELHQQVPLEIIIMVRWRLPPKSLVRFRCISKAWNDITNDLDLARKQLLSCGEIRDPQMICLINFHREKGTASVLRLTFLRMILELINIHTDLSVTSKFSKQNIEINIPSCFKTTFCNGWHCFGARSTDRSHDAPILMHNPLRKETLKLPQISGLIARKDGQAFYGLGFDARNNIFKLTCLLVSVSATRFYLLRHKNFWEMLVLPSHLRKCRHGSCRSNVFLNGSIHYVVQEANGVFRILAFDVEKEQFRCINLPCGLKFPYTLMELGGLLAVNYSSCNGTKLEDDLYVLKDYAKGEWDAPLRLPNSELMMWIIKRKIGTNIVNGGVMGSVVGSTGTQVLFRYHVLFYEDTTSNSQGHHSSYQYLAYDIQTGKITDIASQLPCSASSLHYQEFYGHQLSLVPLIM